MTSSDQGNQPVAHALQRPHARSISMKILSGAALALILALPAFGQIRTPYNSYPPTPAERAETAELNRQANGGRDWDADSYASQDRYREDEQYRRSERTPEGGYAGDEARPGYSREDYPRQDYSRRDDSR